MSSTTEYNSFPPAFAVLGPRIGDSLCVSQCSARAVWLWQAEMCHSDLTPLHSWPHGSRDLERPQAAKTTCWTGCSTHFECSGHWSSQHVGHKLSSRNYANYYQDCTSHTFTHQDKDCNSGDILALICFGWCQANVGLGQLLWSCREQKGVWQSGEQEALQSDSTLWWVQPL